jgi:uncharacterized protein YuzE
MFARVSTISGQEKQIKKVVSSIEDANPTGLEEMKGGYILIDNKAGKVMTITLWETREALEASMPVAKQVLGDAAAAIGVSPVIEVFEVASEI